MNDSPNKIVATAKALTQDAYDSGSGSMVILFRVGNHLTIRDTSTADCIDVPKVTALAKALMEEIFRHEPQATHNPTHT